MLGPRLVKLQDPAVGKPGRGALQYEDCGTKRTVINHSHQLLIQKVLTVWVFSLGFLGQGRG